ncbi:serine/threonine-protein kinase [Clostridium sp. WILCCON 0185]|uniref:non-specific serine/threonine protein kinase n=2 Tax=Candidatus Clostridium stratigraminis TaxID=3381661 RepID=A0ABW8T052_9CLOT
MLNAGYILDGKYEIIDILGKGGMSIVYLCKNNRLGNLWAIKEVLNEWKDKIDFLAEPNLLKNLNHPGIPRIIDIFYENDNLYMVEDYIDGKNLMALVEEKGLLTSETIKSIALQLCDILEYLHSFTPPIIYRDLKPSNIMLKKDGKVILVDFGIARTYKENKDKDTLLLGSKGYMAPEQLYNVQSNIQTDIFSLGATLYYLATGKTFESSEDVKVLYKKAEINDEMLIQLIDMSTAAIPENRFKCMAEFKKMLLKEDYIKTKYISHTNLKDKTLLETKLIKPKYSKKFPILFAGILLLIIALSTSYFLLNSRNSKNSSLDNAANALNMDKSNNGTKNTKSEENKDIITRGILYKNSPTTLNDIKSNNNNDNNEGNNGNEKGKGKNKDKSKPNIENFHLLFTLYPKASIDNSKVNITLNSIELLNSTSILDISISNKTSEDISMNLSNASLQNGNNIAFYPSINDTGNILVSQNISQNIKLYFNDFDFEGSSYCFKTSINYGTDEEVSLFIDVK